MKIFAIHNLIPRAPPQRFSKWWIVRRRPWSRLGRVVQNLQKSWRFLSHDILRNQNKMAAKVALEIYLRKWKPQEAHTSGVSVCSKYKEMYGNIEGLHIVKIYRVMSMLKLKINAKLLQLLCIVISVGQNGEFEQFGGFYVASYYTF